MTENEGVFLFFQRLLYYCYIFYTMAKITITPLIHKQFQRKDGMYTVKIRLYAKGQQKYLSTNISARPEQLTKNLSVKDYALRKAIDTTVDNMYDIANAIPLQELNNMTIDEIADRLTGAVSYKKKFSLDFIDYGRKISDEKPKNSSYLYNAAINSLVEFSKDEHLEIGKITSSFMHQYERYLNSRYGSGARAVSAYTNCIAYLHRRAREEFNNEENGELNVKNPFDYYKTPKQKASKHRCVDTNVIQFMIEKRRTLTGREKTGVELFLISFATMGMNSPDLYDCIEPNDGIIVYNRAKTRDRRADKAEMRIFIEDCVKPLFDDCKGKDGYLFNFRDNYSSYRSLTKYANLGLHSFCEKFKLDNSLTVYSARHTWATLAYSLGVEKYTINDCLCHADPNMQVTDIYIKKDWSILWKANKLVLSQFEWE